MRVLLVALVAACVPSQAELRAPIDRDLRNRLGEPQLDPAQVDALLAHPLDRSAAVRIALANSPRLAADFDALGIAGGELASALGLGPLQIDAQLRFGDGDRELELDAVQDVLGLVAAPRRRAAARAGIAEARARATAAAIRLAARVEIAFDDLVAAGPEVDLRATALAAADAAATIRERMHAAGNATDLALARDRDAREQAHVDLARAEAAVLVRREMINALLGLGGARTTWTVATTELAPVPADPPALDDLERTAVAASLDLAAGRARADAAANRAGAARVGAVLPELGVGVSAIRAGDHWMLGPAVRLGLPLFDQRAGERAAANARVARADHALAADALDLRAAARAARVTAIAAHAEALHLRTVVLPLRQQILDETLKHYNAMDADPFALVLARQGLVDAGHQLLDAQRRFANALTEIAALRRGVMIQAPTEDEP